MAPKREADGFTHSRPGSVDQQSEDTFPASDSPSFSRGTVGAPGAHNGIQGSNGSGKPAKPRGSKGRRKH